MKLYPRMSTKVIASLLLMGLLLICGCGASKGGEEETTTSIPLYETSIEVDCLPNLFFSKYDVGIVVDENNIGILEHGEKKTFTCELVEGEHDVIFQNEEEPSVDGVSTINVTKGGENTFAFQIICTGSQIDIEVIDKEQEAKEAAEKKKREEAEAAAAEAEKAILGLEAKLIGESYLLADDIGYTFKYIDLATEKDITSSIETDSDKYKDWRIMDIGTIDADTKNAELYVLDEKEAARKATENEIDLSSVHKSTKTETNKADGNPTFRIYSNVEDTKENEEAFYSDATLILADHYDLTEEEAAKIIKKIRAGETVIRGDTHIFSSTSSGETYGIFMYTEFFKY